MPQTIYSAQVTGLDAEPIRVEVDITPGLHIFALVGLADKEVQESRERISAAIKNIGALAPHKKAQRVIVNLAPADLKKEGPAFDLPIALGYLLASEQTKFDINGRMFIGELGLDGTVRPVRGTLAIAILAKAAGFRELYVPEGNGKEAAFVPGISIFEVGNVKDCLDHLEGRAALKPVIATELTDADALYEHDLADIRGQESAKRALEIAAAGGHNILFSGPPGTGKTLLAKALASVLPPLSLEEAIEVTKIYSVAGLTRNEISPIAARRPFRSPHHTASNASIIGGGTNPRPGEISLAHRGVLFLDEFPEFQRPVLEALREPLEERRVTVSRMRGVVTYPADFILAAAMNPCPCGNLGNPRANCVCTSGAIMKYQRKVSGPLMDRIDLHVTVPNLTYEKLERGSAGESSDKMRQRVQKARKIQTERLKDEKILKNSEMGVKQVKKFAAPDDVAKSILRNAVDKYALSARGYHRLLKVARTIADLNGEKTISQRHVLEALQYRREQEM
ncbi:MAG: Mg chelatase, subunit ChlI [Parcubacteria group bacterium GW2011_GWA1_51_12]|nr:MAG: Mg chelatase, subunit ChlI [Parcubacteria group bacterium GW2011_GWA1_51_12]